MTDEPEQTTEETQETKPSVLGVDEPTKPAPVQKPEPQPEVEPEKPTQKPMSQDELDALLEKAGNYDLIANDPELSTTIADHFRAKTGRPAQAAEQNMSQEQPQQAQEDPRIAELTRRNALNEIALFRIQNPDMDDHREDMASLINRYGMSLDDAYRFSKQQATPQAAQKPTEGSPARPTVETNNPAGLDQNGDSGLADMERRINDPKATPRLDDAIDLAIAAAKIKHAGNNVEGD